MALTRRKKKGTGHLLFSSCMNLRTHRNESAASALRGGLGSKARMAHGPLQGDSHRTPLGGSPVDLPDGRFEPLTAWRAGGVAMMPCAKAESLALPVSS